MNAAAYDIDNVFAKILRGELPCDKVIESDHALAFKDINPAAPVHVLIIPKGAYVSLDDFTATASEAEIADLYRTVGEVARITGVDKTGFRTIANTGADGCQDVPHFHVHVLGGKNLGPMVATA